MVQGQAWIFQTVQSGGAAGAVPVVLDAFGDSEGVFGAFCAFLRAPPVVPELSASFRSWGALDGEEFFVIEGSGGGADVGSWTPRCQASSCALMSS